MVTIAICVENKGNKKLMLYGDSPSVDKMVNFMYGFSADEMEMSYNKLKKKDLNLIIDTLEKLK